MVGYVDFIVEIFCAWSTTIPSLNREYHCTEDHYTGVLPHTFYYITFAGQRIVDQYTGNIVILKIRSLNRGSTVLNLYK